MSRIALMVGILSNGLWASGLYSPCEMGGFDPVTRRDYNTLYIEAPATLSQATKQCKDKFGSVTVANFHKEYFEELQAQKCDIAEIIEPLLPEFPKPPFPEPTIEKSGWVVCVGKLMPKPKPQPQP